MYSVGLKKEALIPALIGAGVCLFFIKSGFFTLFFLVPLGFLAFRYKHTVVWTCLLFAVFGNILLTAVTSASGAIPGAAIIWDILYFTVMTSVFTWIVAPPPGFSERITDSKRLIAGSCLGAVLFIGIFFRTISSPGFPEYISSALNALISAYSSSGSDVVQTALLGSLTAERIMDIIKSIVLRGGSLAACILLFAICRQISFILARITVRERGVPSLVLFHVPSIVIWILSVSLLLVVFTRAVRLEIPEIFLWNILILCIILYLAQGLGILQFFLARPKVSPLLKLVLSVLFFVLLFSPGINAFLLGGIVFLGIAENWAPLRVSKPNGPPSTPEAGDGGN